MTKNLRFGQPISFTYRQGGSKGQSISTDGLYLGRSLSPMGDIVKVMRANGAVQCIQAHNVEQIA